jgi:hypothetical protein
VEFKFNLTNPNQKPYIESWEVCKETERYYYCKAKGTHSSGRRFFKPNMDQVKYHKLLQYTYSCATDMSYEEFINTYTAKDIIRRIYCYLAGDLHHYNQVLNGIKDYYDSNYCLQEVSNE